MKSYLLPCLNYVRSGGDVPSDCCGGLTGLVNAARTTDDRRAACNCEKSMAENLSNDELNRIETLPDKCGVTLPYNFSPSIDCSQVN
ncbi:non-specific lipid-transfer protein 1-like [Dendrobium catenatum]|uniref:non-specific lipid-transfer protein 1-like n=1 Tax=Dendrobium catenatum TaxID=906689 RepID=UPI00109F395E|nr:non-specific lipid-transfer protein 1-like [Dendrobium catenatum]